MSAQLTFDFRGADRRPVLVRYSKEDREFFAITPLDKLSASPSSSSFLLESRAQRIGCSVDELRCMRSYDLARELAEEVAILGRGDLDTTCRIPATRLDDRLIDALAKLVAAERAEAWQEFLAAKRDGSPVMDSRPSRRKGARA